MNDLVTITSRGQITIPAKMRKSMNLKKGSKALLMKEGDKLTVRPVGTKNIMELYGSIDPGGKSTDPEVASANAKRLKAKADYK